MIRLGLCCKWLEAAIKFRTTTATYLIRLKASGQSPFDYISTLIAHNIDALNKSIILCEQQHIGSFRITSDFLPICTHPELRYRLEDLPYGKTLIQKLIFIRQQAKKAKIRLTFHPDQFVVLSSTDRQITARSIADLEYHAYLAELLGADVINIHVGGAYGNKEKALQQFKSNFSSLSNEIKGLVSLENDDKTYTPEDLIPVCKELNLPFVYDVHHHRCNKDSLSEYDATQAALKTWNREPLFHISSPLDGWSGLKPFRHHDYISIEDVPASWKDIPSLTIEVEAKAKERAVAKLRKELKEQGWKIA